MNYSANDNLEVMKIARNYNSFLINNVVKLINKYNFKNVLDFGCSDGYFIKEILNKANNVNIFGVEKDISSIQACTKSDIKVYDDILKVNSELDLIYSFNVLEHIKDDKNILLLIHEKLKKNGKLLLYVPALSFLYSSMDKKTGHYRRYNKNELVKKVKFANFKIDVVEYCDSLGVLASIAYLLLDKIKDNKGDINKTQIKLYDLIFPLSRFFDKLFFHHIAGKNILLIATKI